MRGIDVYRLKSKTIQNFERTKFMKIIFNRNEITKAIAPLMSSVSGKSTLTAIDGILIEAECPDVCNLTTFDLEKGIRISIKADVIEAGSYIINAQKFNQTLKVMDSEDITLTVDDKLTATFESGRSNHKTGALKSSDFPEIPFLKTEKGFIVDQALLREMLLKVSYAMDVNNPRPVLNGCYIRTEGGELKLVACDTVRLAVCSCAAEFEKLEGSDRGTDFKFIMPSKSVNELVKLLSSESGEKATVYMSHKNIVIVLGDLIFFSRLINGEYLDYERVIIRHHKIFVDVDKDSLLSALERAALITEERIVGNVRSNVKLTVESDVLKISAVSTAGSIYDEVPIEHEGEDIVISFNNRYLMDSVRACSADKIRISLSSKLMSVNIEPSADAANGSSDELFMLLPVRTKD